MKIWGYSKNNNILLCPTKLYKKWPSLLQKAWPSLSLAIAIIFLVFFPAPYHQSVLHNIAEHLSKLCLSFFSPTENHPRKSWDKAQTLWRGALGPSEPHTQYLSITPPAGPLSPCPLLTQQPLTLHMNYKLQTTRRPWGKSCAYL